MNDEVFCTALSEMVLPLQHMHKALELFRVSVPCYSTGCSCYHMHAHVSDAVLGLTGPCVVEKYSQIVSQVKVGEVGWYVMKQMW